MPCRAIRVQTRWLLLGIDKIFVPKSIKFNQTIQINRLCFVSSSIVSFGNKCGEAGYPGVVHLNLITKYEKISPNPRILSPKNPYLVIIFYELDDSFPNFGDRILFFF